MRASKVLLIMTLAAASASGFAAPPAPPLVKFEGAIGVDPLTGANGVEVARRLRAEATTTGIRIVLHSARDEPVVRARFDGYDGYIHKSEDPEVLLEGIRSALTRPHAAVPEAETQAG